MDISCARIELVAVCCLLRESNKREVRFRVSVVDGAVQSSGRAFFAPQRACKSNTRQLDWLLQAMSRRIFPLSSLVYSVCE
jgi:hypothetical protein